MAKPNTPNNKPKAHLDFKNELWNAANDLRGTSGVVMAIGAITSGSAGEKNVCEYMLRHHMVDCFVQMPDKLF